MTSNNLKLTVALYKNRTEVTQKHIKLAPTHCVQLYLF